MPKPWSCSVTASLRRAARTYFDATQRASDTAIGPTPIKLSTFLWTAKRKPKVRSGHRFCMHLRGCAFAKKTLTTSPGWVPIAQKYADRHLHMQPASRIVLNGAPDYAHRRLHTLTGAGQANYLVRPPGFRTWQRPSTFLWLSRRNRHAEKTPCGRDSHLSRWRRPAPGAGARRCAEVRSPGFQGPGMP